MQGTLSFIFNLSLFQVHFVHYKESYGSLGNAADKPEGLAVLAWFFEVSISVEYIVITEAKGFNYVVICIYS